MSQGTPGAALPAGWSWEAVADRVPTEAVHYLRHNHHVRYVVFRAGAQWRAKHTPDGLGVRSDVVFIQAFPDVEAAKRACEEAAGRKTTGVGS